MTILITGVAGFIGSHSAEFYLKKGYKVIGLDNYDDFYASELKHLNLEICKSNSNFKLIEGDILDTELLVEIFSSYQFDFVIHLAAKAGVRPSVLNPEIYKRVNVDGTQNLLETMTKLSSAKLLFASSSSVYGETNNVPFRENEKLSDPVSPYAATKIEGEKLCHTFAKKSNLKYTILRFFSVYGPRQRPDMGISKFFNQLINHLPVTLYGDGTTRRDYTFIEDIVQGIALSAELPGDGEIINLGNSEPITLANLISSIENVIGESAQIEYQERKEGDVFQTYASIEVAQRTLGYNPSTKLTEGLKKQFEYLKIQSRV
jgi:UDP-glucuronate 4-epimerase